MNMYQVLERFATMEEKLSELYGHWAVQFAHIPECATLFRRLQTDEISHRNMIHFQQRLLLQKAGTFNVTEMEVEVVENLITEIDTMIHSVGQTTLDQALRFAIATENGAGEYHCRKSASLSNTSLSSLLDHLSRDDRTHCQTLERVAGTYLDTVDGKSDDNQQK